MSSAFGNENADQGGGKTGWAPNELLPLHSLNGRMSNTLKIQKRAQDTTKSATDLAAKQRDRLSTELAKAQAKGKAVRSKIAVPSKLRNKIAAKDSQVKRGSSKVQRLYEQNSKMRADIGSMDSLLARYRSETDGLRTAEQEVHNLERQISLLEDQKVPASSSLLTRSLLEANVQLDSQGSIAELQGKLVAARAARISARQSVLHLRTQEARLRSQVEQRLAENAALLNGESPRCEGPASAVTTPRDANGLVMDGEAVHEAAAETSAELRLKLDTLDQEVKRLSCDGSALSITSDSDSDHSPTTCPASHMPDACGTMLPRPLATIQTSTRGACSTAPAAATVDADPSPKREVDLIHHAVLTKQLACTALERGLAESEVQALLVRQAQLVQEAKEKDDLFADLQTQVAEAQSMCDQIAADRHSVKAAMADLEVDHSRALDILSRNLSASEVGVSEALSKHSSLSAACSKLAAEKLRLQQQLVKVEEAAESSMQEVSIGKTAAENHARRLHQRVQELEEGSAATEAESKQLGLSLGTMKEQMEQLVGALTQSKLDLAATKTEMADAQHTFELSLESSKGYAARLETERDEAQHQRDALAVRGKALESELAAEIEKISVMRSTYQLGADARAAEIDGQMAGHQAAAEAAQRRAADMAAELQSAASMKVRALMRVSELDAQLEERATIVNLLVADVEEAKRRGTPRGEGAKEVVSMAFQKIRDLQQELQEVTDQLLERDEVVAGLQRSINVLKAERDAASKLVRAMTVRSEEQDAEHGQRMRALEAQYASLQSEHTTLQEVNLLLTSDLAGAEQATVAANEATQVARADVSKLNDQVSRLKAEGAALIEDVAAVSRSLQDAQAQEAAQAASAAAQSADLRAQLVALEAENRSLMLEGAANEAARTAAAEAAAAAAKALQADIAGLHQQLQASEARAQMLTSEHAYTAEQLAHSVAEATAAAAAAHLETDTLRAEVAALLERLQEAGAQSAALDREQAAATAREDTLAGGPNAAVPSSTADAAALRAGVEQLQERLRASELRASAATAQAEAAAAAHARAISELEGALADGRVEATVQREERAKESTEAARLRALCFERIRALAATGKEQAEALATYKERTQFLDHEIECRDRAIAKIRADLEAATTVSEGASEDLRRERDCAQADFKALTASYKQLEGQLHASEAVMAAMRRADGQTRAASAKAHAGLTADLEAGKAALAKSRSQMEAVIDDMRDGMASRSVVIERLEASLQDADHSLALAHAKHAAELQEVKKAQQAAEAAAAERDAEVRLLHMRVQGYAAGEAELLTALQAEGNDPASADELVTQQAITRIQSLTTQLEASAASRMAAAQELEQVHARLLCAHAQLESQQAAAAAAAEAAGAEAARELAIKEADLELRARELETLQAALAECESGAAQSRKLHADLLDTRAQQVAGYEKALLESQARHAAMLADVQRLSEDLEAVRKECAARTAAIATASTVTKELQQQRNAATGRAASAAADLESASSEVFALREQVAVQASELEVALAAAADATATQAAAQAELSAARKSVTSSTAERATIAAQLTEVTQRMDAAAASARAELMRARESSQAAEAALEARAAGAEHERDLFELIARDALDECEEAVCAKGHAEGKAASAARDAADASKLANTQITELHVLRQQLERELADKVAEADVQQQASTAAAQALAAATQRLADKTAEYKACVLEHERAIKDKCDTITGLELELASVTDELASVRMAHQFDKSKLASAQERVRAYKAEREQLEGKISTAQGSIRRLDKELREARSQIQVAERTMQTMAADTHAAQAASKQLRGEKAALAEQRDGLSRQCKGLEQQLSAEQVAAAEREAGHVSVRTAAFQRIKQETQRSSELRCQNEGLQQEVESLGRSLAQWQSSAESAASELERSEGARAAAAEKLAAWSDRIAALEKEVQESRARCMDEERQQAAHAQLEASLAREKAAHQSTSAALVQAESDLQQLRTAVAAAEAAAREATQKAEKDQATLDALTAQVDGLNIAAAARCVRVADLESTVATLTADAAESRALLNEREASSAGLKVQLGDTLAELKTAQTQAGQGQSILRLTFAKVKTLQDGLAREAAAAASATARAAEVDRLLISVRGAAAAAAEQASADAMAATQDLQQQVVALQQEQKHAAGREANLLARLASTEASAALEVQRLGVRLAAVETELADERTAHAAATAEVVLLNAQVEDVSRQLESLVAELTADRASAEAEGSAALTTHRQLSAMIATLGAELSAARAALQNAQAELQEQQDSLASQVSQVEGSVATAKAHTAAAEADKVCAEEEAAGLRVTLEDARSHAAAVEQELASVRDTAGNDCARVQRLEAQLSAAAVRAVSLTTELRAAEGRAQQAAQQAIALEAKAADADARAARAEASSEEATVRLVAADARAAELQAAVSASDERCTGLACDLNTLGAELQAARVHARNVLENQLVAARADAASDLEAAQSEARAAQAAAEHARLEVAEVRGALLSKEAALDKAEERAATDAAGAQTQIEAADDARGAAERRAASFKAELRSAGAAGAAAQKLAASMQAEAGSAGTVAGQLRDELRSAQRKNKSLAGSLQASVDRVAMLTSEVSALRQRVELRSAPGNKLAMPINVQQCTAAMVSGATVSLALACMYLSVQQHM